MPMQEAGPLQLSGMARGAAFERWPAAATSYCALPGICAHLARVAPPELQTKMPRLLCHRRGRQEGRLRPPQLCQRQLYRQSMPALLCLNDDDRGGSRCPALPSIWRRHAETSRRSLLGAAMKQVEARMPTGHIFDAAMMLPRRPQPPPRRPRRQHCRLMPKCPRAIRPPSRFSRGRHD